MRKPKGPIKLLFSYFERHHKVEKGRMNFIRLFTPTISLFRRQNYARSCTFNATVRPVQITNASFRGQTAVRVQAVAAPRARPFHSSHHLMPRGDRPFEQPHHSRCPRHLISCFALCHHALTCTMIACLVMLGLLRFRDCPIDLHVIACLVMLGLLDLRQQTYDISIS